MSKTTPCNNNYLINCKKFKKAIKLIKIETVSDDMWEIFIESNL